MNILSLENVSKNYGFKPLFEGVMLGLEENERVGVIGANGSGKTTLLRIIAGLEPPDAGRVVRASGKIIAYLSQNPPVNDKATVLETVFAATGGVIKLLRDYELACHELALHGGADEQLFGKVADLQHELELANGWDLENNARTVLTRLGINDTTAKMGELSGGQRKRVALARELIVKPDLLILDEPTNHLDADTINWLESYLANYWGALLLVTHDRYFLDRVTNRILEIDRGGVQSFAGNYVYYLEKKDEQETLRAVEGQKRKMLVRKELAWLRRGAKARTRKSKSRVNAAYDLIAQPVERAKSELDIAIGSRRLGSKVVELENISKSYDGNKLINDFSYIVKRDDRIGMIGANGAGKTTLLEIITGRIQPEKGKIETGATVVIGYYDQESRALDDEQRVIDYIREAAEYVTTADGSQITASQMLEKFLFPPAVQYALVGKLSGGERRRLYLLRILMSAPNVLILDEPTNDLDIPTLIALEEYLDDFPGALIVVSHDRYFLDRTIDRVFKFGEGGNIHEYPGDYTTYLKISEREETEKVAQIRVSNAANKLSVAQANSAPTMRKLSFKEKRELESLEKQIAIVEARISELESFLSLNSSDAGKVHELFTERQKFSEQLENNMERWLELSERANL
ncbi:MAG: ABC-F family ATP-binding cassette domain-containing protein [Pyrinomonadaceae bacterium]